MNINNLENFYSKQIKFYNPTRNLFLSNRKFATELLEIKNDDKILDLACGTGLNFSYLLEKTDSKNITGIDYSKSMLKKAKKDYPMIRLIKADVSSYKFGSKVDKILVTYSISMINDWQRTIVNIRKALNKNGTCVILDFYPWKGKIKIFYPFFKWWLKKHGVDPEKEIISFAKKHFKKVKVLILNSGYNYIMILKYPRLFEGNEKYGKE